ncbi:MAG: diguanylate cyclase [Ruminococcus sp.]|nr:diguanylate cyclase [Ruminococcus sp.]
MKKRKTIAFLTACPENGHVVRAMDGLSAQCLKYDYDLAVFSAMTALNTAMPDYTLGEKNIYSLPNYDLIDGVIVDTALLLDGNGESFPDSIYEDLQKRCTKPVVALDMPLHSYPLIASENEESLRDMVRHAIEVHGCKKICLVSGPEGNYAGKYRMEIFLDEVRRHGLEVADEHIIYSDFWYLGGSSVGKDIGEGKISRPDAVICGNDYLAIGFIYKIRKYGIKVPDDIIVIGFEASDEAAGNDISVSSIEPNDSVSAANCVDFLRKQIEPDKEVIPYDGTYKFFAGMSCGCQPDYSRSIQSIHDHIYFTCPNYADEEMFDHLDIGMLMESYISEGFTASETPEDCIKNINERTYLIFPFVNFYLCLKNDWLDASRDICDGYPEKMKIVAANTQCGELYFYTDEESIIFDTNMMIPRLYDNTDDKPSVYYFSPVHFGSDTLGYCVLQRWLEDTHRLNLVYRNWIRFVNNALEMTRAKRRLLTMSLHDEMTGAFNRRGMYVQLEKLMESAGERDSLFVCVIDMDRLKYINDNFGHTEGDYGIKTVSNAASSVTLSREIFVRAGGDEFYIIGVGRYDNDAGEKRISAFENVMNAMTSAAEKPYPLTASLGTAIRPFEKDMNIEDVINEADEIMYQNKVAKKCQRV